MKDYSLIEKAARIAIVAHKEQKRKSDNFPYIIHPFMVAMILMRYNFSDTVIAAGLVHDTVEDTSVSLKEISEELGSEVAEIVMKVSEESKGVAWEDRKRAYIEAIRKSPEEVKAVSLADKIHNITNMIEAYKREGEEFWKNFSRGKADQVWFAQELLKMFSEGWNHPMVDEYKTLVESFSKLCA